MNVRILPNADIHYSRTKLVCEKILMYCHNRMDFPQEIGTQHDKC